MRPVPSMYVQVLQVERLRRKVCVADGALLDALDQDAPDDVVEQLREGLDSTLEELAEVEDSYAYQHELQHLDGETDARQCQGMGCPLGDV